MFPSSARVAGESLGPDGFLVLSAVMIKRIIRPFNRIPGRDERKVPREMSSRGCERARFAFSSYLYFTYYWTIVRKIDPSGWFCCSKIVVLRDTSVTRMVNIRAILISADELISGDKLTRESTLAHLRSIGMIEIRVKYARSVIDVILIFRLKWIKLCRLENSGHLKFEISRSSRRELKRNKKGPGLSARLICGKVQNLLLLCQIAVGSRDRHATKKKQYFVTIVYVLDAVEGQRQNERR